MSDKIEKCIMPGCENRRNGYTTSKLCSPCESKQVNLTPHLPKVDISKKVKP